MGATADDVSPGVHTQAATALQALDTSIPLAARVERALSDEMAVAVIHQWAPKGELARSITLAGSSPPLEDMPYAAFVEDCNLLQKAGVVPKNILVEEACEFLAALEQAGVTVRDTQSGLRKSIEKQ